MEYSKLWFLNHKDWIKAGVQVFVVGAIGVILAFLQAGGHIAQLDWVSVLEGSLKAGLGYLVIKLNTNQSGNIVAVEKLTGVKTGPEAGDNQR